MAVVTFLAWRVSNRQFTVWHMCQNARETLCGRIPPSDPHAALSFWDRTGTPPVEKTCLVCRQREAQEMRNR